MSESNSELGRLHQEVERLPSENERLRSRITYLERWQSWRRRLEQVEIRPEPGEVEKWLAGNKEPQPE